MVKNNGEYISVGEVLVVINRGNLFGFLVLVVLVVLIAYWLSMRSSISSGGSYTSSPSKVMLLLWASDPATRALALMPPSVVSAEAALELASGSSTHRLDGLPMR